MSSLIWSTVMHFLPHTEVILYEQNCRSSNQKEWMWINVTVNQKRKCYWITKQSHWKIGLCTEDMIYKAHYDWKKLQV